MAVHSATRTSFLDWFEGFFGTPLTTRTRPAYLNMTTSYAQRLFDAYIAYHEEYHDFFVPPRARSQSRPFLWHEVGNGGHWTGGISKSTATASILLHDSIVVTDGLRLPLSGLASGDLDTAMRWYQEFIDFVVHFRQLIVDGTILIVSEKAAYAHLDNVSDDDDLQQFFMRNADFIDLAGREKHVLGYLAVSDHYNADPVLSGPYQKVVDAIFYYWQLQNAPDIDTILSFQDRLDFDFSDLDLQTIASMRKNDDAFADVRRAVRDALNEDSQEGFRDQISQGFSIFNGRQASKSHDVGMAVFFATLSTAAGLTVAGPPGAAIGAATSIGLSIINDHVKRIKEERRRCAYTVFKELGELTSKYPQQLDYDIREKFKRSVRNLIANAKRVKE